MLVAAKISTTWMVGFCLVLISVFSLVRSDTGSVAMDRAALLSIRSTLRGRTLLWDATGWPCVWEGVTCSGGRVVALRLPAMGLVGTLPVDTLANLTRLRTLSLRYNSLSGPLPYGLVSLSGSFRNLYLQGNRFEGPIPESIFSMRGLVRLNLAGNRLTGGISPRFNDLVGLKSLLVERNGLTGSLPELSIKLDQFNVSQNGLVGLVPPSLSGFPSSAFQGNSLCGMPLAPCNQTETRSAPSTLIQTSTNAPIPTPSETETETHTESIPSNVTPKRKFSHNMNIAIGSVVGFCSVIAIVAAISTMKMRRRIELRKDVHAYSSKQSDQAGNNTLVFLKKGGSVFELEELLMASAEVLGNGSHGTCYKATPRNGTAVSVKRLKDVNVKESEYDEKMMEIARMEHPNLVPLLAYYHSKDVKLLVHEYVPNGSLSSLLHGEDASVKARLNWQTWHNIMLGAARGIKHIHSISPLSSHGNVKSSNILLTESYEARASDFGLSSLVGPNTSLLLGLTRGGYRAPEVIDPRVTSQEADVYSFGVVLLELLTGKDPCGRGGGDSTADCDLPMWIRSASVDEIFDEGLAGRDNDVDRRGITELLKIATDCTDRSPANRPTMAEVVRRMETALS
ncbi:hypothetical protein MLD38_033778 [Melastoma candidum]|uniref:Uncharacterized protein n=1 Tax=Melastoma candidum TaxID=119954 RepID=A0ACB9M9Z0_9MYRT|nr:hypothetical protein MLD38_033778 [Melastoma candidum]